MAPLVGIASNFRTVLAAHVAFEFMDWRRLRSPHDVEGNGLMRVAAEAFHFEITITRVESIRRARAMAVPDPESRACARSTPQRRAGRLPCVLPSPALPPPGSTRRRWSRVILCPCDRGCAWPRRTGKPLQIAVDDVPGTTEATKPTGCGRSSSRARDSAGRSRRERTHPARPLSITACRQISISVAMLERTHVV
jgi:hypothetical protein